MNWLGCFHGCFVEGDLDVVLCDAGNLVRVDCDWTLGVGSECGLWQCSECGRDQSLSAAHTSRHTHLLDLFRGMCRRTERKHLLAQSGSTPIFFS